MIDRTNVTAPPENVGPATAFVRGKMLAEQAAPSVSRGPVGWMREHLFPSVPQTILTLVCIYVLYLIVPPIANFMDQMLD